MYRLSNYKLKKESSSKDYPIITDHNSYSPIPVALG